MEAPVLSFALPLQSETHWSDLLAVLIATDPGPLGAVIGLDYGPGALTVSREASVSSASRPDIVLTANGSRIAVIEVKVLAGLSPRQLERYHEAVPGARAYVLVYPERLAIPLHDAELWRELTWESLLRAYEESDHSWVAATARAWRHHLDSALPKVRPGIRWNDLREGEDFAVALRTRMSWLYSQVPTLAGVEHDLVGSSAGVSWVVRLYAETPVPGYWIMSEVEENLPVRDYPRYFTPGGRRPLGPSAKVCLYQDRVETSAGFDWAYLHRLWPLWSRPARTGCATRPGREPRTTVRDTSGSWRRGRRHFSASGSVTLRRKSTRHACSEPAYSSRQTAPLARSAPKSPHSPTSRTG